MSGMLAGQVVRQFLPLSSCETAKITLPALNLVKEREDSDGNVKGGNSPPPCGSFPCAPYTQRDPERQK